MITITLQQIIIEILVSTLTIAFVFLIIWVLILKDETKALKNMLETQTLIAGKWKAFYHDFYNNDYCKLLGKNIIILQENLTLKKKLHLTGMQFVKTKKDLNQALNEMNQHSDKKVLDCLEDEFRKELKKNNRKN